MLELKVADYCHDCPYFEPVLGERSIGAKRGLYAMAENTYIFCSKDNMCAMLATHIEKKLKGEA